MMGKQQCLPRTAVMAMGRRIISMRKARQETPWAFDSDSEEDDWDAEFVELNGGKGALIAGAVSKLGKSWIGDSAEVKAERARRKAFVLKKRGAARRKWRKKLGGVQEENTRV